MARLIARNSLGKSAMMKQHRCIVISFSRHSYTSMSLLTERKVATVLEFGTRKEIPRFARR